MKRTFLALTCLALALLAALIFGVGLGVAQTSAPLHDPRPSPTPDGLGPAEAPASPDIPPMPDLVVTAIEVVPSTPLINEQVTIRVTIKNQSLSDVPLGNSFYTDLYIDPSVLPIQLFQDGVYAWGCQSYWVPAGESYTLLTTLVFTDVRVYALWAQIDTDAQVAEANENNNILGPVHVQVVAPNTLVQQTHQDFQMGMASNMDLSHPDGVMRRGIFLEPSTEADGADPDVYRPDAMINDVTGTWTVPYSYTTVNQVKPALAGDGSGNLFAVWEDGRNGGVYNRDIYFSRKDAGSATWGPNVQVNTDDPTGNQLSPDLAYDGGRLYAVWQDGRDGPDDYDIYFAYSDDGNNWTERMISQLANGDPSLANQMNPSIAIGPSGSVYVVWQDRRNGNDDVYLARSDDRGDTWSPNYFVTDDPAMTAQNQVNPSIDVQDLWGIDVVYVCWEDWRVADHPEIYVADSTDGGQTFGVDVPVTESGGGSYRVEPSIAVGLWMSPTLPPYDVYMHDIHVAWQEGQGNDADVYWAYANRDFIEGGLCPWPRDFCFEPPQKVNGYVLSSDYALPSDTGPTWAIEPSWQGQVDLTLAAEKDPRVVSENDPTFCHMESREVYSRGVFIVWSDARSYDSWRYELYTRRVASAEGFGSYEICEDVRVLYYPDTGVLNDNAKLYPYRDDPDRQVYELYKPAATRQSNPSIYRDDTGVYVAWDDDRWDDPLRSGTVRNRDVFYAEMGISDDAIYISPVLDARAEAQWYVLSWWAATEHSDDLLLQTRFGISGAASPPHEDVEANGWTRWTGNSSSTYPDCPTGAGVDCYYDAPGRHIVDPDGKEWIGCSGSSCPISYRYIQYKVVIRSTSPWWQNPFKTALSQVKIYYKGGNTVYLPIVIKKH